MLVKHSPDGCLPQRGLVDMKKNKDSPLPKAIELQLTDKADVKLTMFGWVKVSVAKRGE